ncbi:MAG: hypothetical protein ACD_40C00331G0012 [uncultured bacterium]|nr:MAG: hypothetical protein ACD_40C00331G0012 [uncultured bacterium]
MIMNRQLSQHAITTLQEKYFAYFGIQLSDEDANTKGLELLQYLKVIYKPIPKEN